MRWPEGNCSTYWSDWSKQSKHQSIENKYLILSHPRRTNVTSSCEALTLNDTELKHLKVVINEGLKWNEQFTKVRGKVTGGLWSLKGVWKGL